MQIEADDNLRVPQNQKFDNKVKQKLSIRISYQIILQLIFRFFKKLI